MRMVVYLLSLCFFINQVACLQAIELQESEIIAHVVAAESEMFRLVAVSALPFAIIDTMLYEKAAFAAVFTASATAHKEKKKNQKNSRSDTCLYNTDTSEISSLWKDANYCGLSFAMTFDPAVSNRDSTRTSNGFIFIMLFVLAYLIVLSKSNLPWSFFVDQNSSIYTQSVQARLGF
jgi:hypothetical protein